MADDDLPPRALDRVPDQGDDPIVWDPVQRRFVPTSAKIADPGAVPAPPRDPRKFFIGPDAVGRDLPPQPGTPPLVGAAGIAAAGVGVGPVGASRSAPPSATTTIERPPSVGAPPKVLPDPRPASTPAPPMHVPAPAVKKRRGRLLPRRPKLRYLFMVLPLVLLLIAGGGLWYANQQFKKLHRVPVGSLMDPIGSAQNILIIGSDSRDVPVAVDGEPSPTGQRSDTMMVLRLDSSGARMLSVPRDLIVTIAESSQKARINAAYNTDLGGGPARLIKTVKDNLKIPINRYIEVDFATFAGVVDSIGGITVDFPHPATDDFSGLDIQQTGPVVLNGEQALSYVRSRHYTELINGKKVEEPTADLGRVKRQQQFLTAVLGKVGRSRNPITLLQVGGEVVKGLRVDDKLGLWDAMRLAWDLKGLHPESVELPTALNKDHATLKLKEPDADGVLATFR
jgi:LCP family protein required for cell wall assembly